MIDRKKPNWTLWTIAVLMGLPVLYVASFGPALWLSDQLKSVRVPVAAVYWPLGRITRHGGQAGTPLRWYVSVCVSPFGTDSSGNFFRVPIRWDGKCQAFWVKPEE